jgi:hypothetical protein
MFLLINKWGIICATVWLASGGVRASSGMASLPELVAESTGIHMMGPASEGARIGNGWRPHDSICCRGDAPISGEESGRDSAPIRSHRAIPMEFYPAFVPITVRHEAVVSVDWLTMDSESWARSGAGVDVFKPPDERKGPKNFVEQFSSFTKPLMARSAQSVFSGSNL